MNYELRLLMTRMVIHKWIACALAFVNLGVWLYPYFDRKPPLIDSKSVGQFWFWSDLVVITLIAAYPAAILLRSKWLARIFVGPPFALTTVIVFFKFVAFIFGAHNDGDHYFIEDDLKPEIKFLSLSYMTVVAWVWELKTQRNR